MMYESDPDISMSQTSMELNNHDLHKVEILGTIRNNFSDLSSDVHPQCEADVKVSRSSLTKISGEDDQVTISLNEVLGHLLPERLLQFRLKVEFLLSPQDTLSQILETSPTLLGCS